MPDTITAAELAEMQRMGATVVRKPGDMDKLIQTLISVVQQTREPDPRITDLLMMLKDTIEKPAIPQTAPEIRLNPTIRIPQQPAPVVNVTRAAYVFEIERDERGRMKTVKAIPDGG